MKLLLSLILVISNLSWGKLAPSFQGELLGGGRISLAEELAKDKSKALLLCFWASWCAPCMQELKQVTEKLKNDPSLPVRVLTVNVDTAETASDVKPTLKLYQFKVPVIFDQKHEIFSKYQDSNSLPFSVLIKPNGEIAETFNGFHDGMFSKVRAAVP
jgi:peroxiredoxin